MNMETGGFDGDDRRKYIVPALIVAAALIVLLLILGITAIIRSRNSATSPTAVTSPTARGPIVAGSSSPVSTRTTTAPGASSSARPSTSGAPSTGASTAPGTGAGTAPSASGAPNGAGKAFVIANTGGDNVNMRSSASAAADVVARLAPGDQIVEIGPVANADDREWRHVRTSDGIEGWVASEFTAPAP